jgi:beta-galactosidase
MRLPKEIFFAHRVIQSERPDLHILGHWSYPTDKPTVKTVYVIANTESVELIVNGKSAGVNSQPESGWIFAFPNVTFAPGSLKAIGKDGATIAAQQELPTAGPAAAIKLTPIVGPKGLQADGQDVALIDFEVVDAKGVRCPTDDARVDFTCSGPGIWRGGYNSGKLDSTNNLYLNTEAGINRVAVRSTAAAGTITVTAKRDGLKAAQVQMASKAVVVTDGVATFMSPKMPGPAEK